MASERCFVKWYSVHQHMRARVQFQCDVYEPQLFINTDNEMLFLSFSKMELVFHLPIRL